MDDSGLEANDDRRASSRSLGGTLPPAPSRNHRPLLSDLPMAAARPAVISAPGHSVCPARPTGLTTATSLTPDERYVLDPSKRVHFPLTVERLAALLREFVGDDWPP